MKKVFGFVIAMLFLFVVAGSVHAAVGGHVETVKVVDVGASPVTVGEASTLFGGSFIGTPLTPVVTPTLPALTDSDHKSNLAPHFVGTSSVVVAVLSEVAGSADKNVIKLSNVAQFSAPDFKLFLRTHTPSSGVVQLPYAGGGLVISSVGTRAVATIPANTYAFVDSAGRNPQSHPTNDSPYLVVNVADGSAGDLDPAVGVVSIQPVLAAADKGSGGGGGGCNAGFAASAVLVLLSAGFALSRKRTL
jgi:hypothetical protein